MESRRQVRLRDGRTLQVHDSDEGAAPGTLAALWHHGSPQTGALLEPLVRAAASRGIRMLSYARPSYGGSSPQRGRDVASAAGDVAQVADTLGIERFAVMGASGGGPHALACAALLPDRVLGAVSIAGLAPRTAGFDWYAGMRAPGGLEAAERGAEARRRYAESSEFDANSFTASDWAALEGAWSSLGADAMQAGTTSPDGLIEDDLAFVAPWGFDAEQIAGPVLVVQGGEDRVVPPGHADWLVRHCRNAELWLRPGDGHISILDTVPLTLDWLHARAEGR